MLQWAAGERAVGGGLLPVPNVSGEGLDSWQGGLGDDVAMFGEVEGYLTAIVETARAVLDRNFVGAYAAGSLCPRRLPVGP